MSTQIKYDQVGISQNEIFCHHTLNQNFNKLIENDNILYESYKSLFSSINITDYDDSKTDYQYGDLVWYTDSNHDKQLFLLKCLIDNNPNKVYIPTNLSTDYEQSNYLLQIGWYNENDNLNILNLGIKEQLSGMVDSKLQEHQQDDDYHPFGELNSENIDSKVLKIDLSNIDSTRTEVFFPNTTNKVDPNKAVMKGYYRCYDNGLLEYDIIFKFGNDKKHNTSSTSIFGTSSSLSANNLNIKSSGGITTITSYDNRKYFYNASNGDIFQSSDGKDSRIGNVVIKNRNNYVNTYQATIYFPKIFRDTNYMIFSNMIMSQAEKTKDGNKFLVPSQNEIVFCNKTLESVTAINVTYPNYSMMQDETYNSENQGMASNSFHCRIIGMGE